MCFVLNIDFQHRPWIMNGTNGSEHLQGSRSLLVRELHAYLEASKILNYIYNNVNKTRKEQTGRQRSSLFSVVCRKIHIFGCPGNTRCNAILKNILSLTNDQIPGCPRGGFCTRKLYKNGPPHHINKPKIYPMRHPRWVQACCITSTLPPRTNQAVVFYP